VIGCESKNMNQTDMCGKEIDLHAQNLSTTLDIIINIISDSENLHFDIENVNHISFENYEELQMQFGFANLSH
jgi:hypothetical protein